MACAAPQAAPPGHLIVQVASAPNNFDPRVGTDEMSQRVAQLVFSNLMALDENLRVVPSLAARLENPDPLTYIAHLRSGVLFHDGSELTLEDIVSTSQRPKLEEYPTYIYIVLQMMHYEHEAGTLEAEQLSHVVGDAFGLSFQEAKEGEVFEPVRRRLREGRGRIRSAGSDYLAYALLDLVVDYYLDVLEGLGEHLEALEDAITTNPDPVQLRSINRLRRQVLFLRRSIWPLRDVVTALERSTLPFMTADVGVFFRDVYDHTVRTAEMIEASREVLASMTELYLSTVSQRMNEIMKVLAVISTFFLPLTFIAGLYGMNFDPGASPLNMPELDWYYGYPFALTLMAAIAVVMFVFFRRRGWL